MGGCGKNMNPEGTIHASNRMMVKRAGGYKHSIRGDFICLIPQSHMKSGYRGTAEVKHKNCNVFGKQCNVKKKLLY